ncbi:MAG: tRNA-binding protein [Proteobacteria bacterium]|nr:tRNA-binding protein [Pseudomonadota bacterium]
MADKRPITWADFDAVRIHVGTVLSAEPFPEALKPAFKLVIDFGELGIRKSSAQITIRYDPTDLVGRQVLAVVNFPPRRIAGFKSEVLVLGAVPEEGGVVLVGPDARVPDGTRIL